METAVSGVGVGVAIGSAYLHSWWGMAVAIAIVSFAHSVLKGR